MIIDIVHHSADYDGKFSGAVCKYWLEKAGHDTRAIGWDFGDPDPVLRPEAEQVYLVDLSVPSVLADPRVIWLDHHKSAIESNAFDIPGYRIDGVAACRLTWQWFLHQAVDFQSSLPTIEDYKNHKVDEPLAIRLAGEYDIFDLRDSRAVPFQYGLYAEEWDLDRLVKLFFAETDVSEQPELGDAYVAQYVDNGRIAMKWHRQMAKEHLKEQGYLTEFEGVTFQCLNSCHVRGSLWFPQEAIDPKAQGLMACRMKGNGIVDISLYGLEGNTIDMSEIAKKWGGGGHFSASGLRMPLQQALELGVIK